MSANEILLQLWNPTSIIALKYLEYSYIIHVQCKCILVFEFTFC